MYETLSDDMTRTGADLIAWYLNPDRLSAERRWSRRHADSQRRLCQRFAAPVIGAVTCQDITASHTQKVVNAALTAGEDRRVHRMLSALVNAGIKVPSPSSSNPNEVRAKDRSRITSTKK
jgi:hypothetical protein